MSIILKFGSATLFPRSCPRSGSPFMGEGSISPGSRPRDPRGFPDFILFVELQLYPRPVLHIFPQVVAILKCTLHIFATIFLKGLQSPELNANTQSSQFVLFLLHFFSDVCCFCLVLAEIKHTQKTAEVLRPHLGSYLFSWRIVRHNNQTSASPLRHSVSPSLRPVIAERAFFPPVICQGPAVSHSSCPVFTTPL